MRKNLFFENISQAICLITKRITEIELTNDFVFEFNSIFEQRFPEINSSNIFDKLNLEAFVKSSFAFQEKESGLVFYTNYHDKNYSVYRSEIGFNQYALLFTEEKKDTLNTEVLKVDPQEVGNFGGLGYLINTFDKAPVLVVITDKLGIIEYVNSKFAEVTGFSKEEAIGKNANILKSGSQSDEFYKEMWMTILDNRIWNNCFHNRKKSGQLFWQRTHMIPLRDESGLTSHFIALGEDITESKAIETIVEEKSDLFFQLIESMPDIVCIKDADGRWLLANSAIIKLFELEGVKYYGKTDAELAEYSPFYKKSLNKCTDTDKIAWDSGKMTRSDEKVILRDGSKLIIDALKIPSYNSDDSRNRLILLGRDITIRKKALEDLKQIEKRYALAQKVGGVASWEWDIEKLTLNWADNLNQVFETFEANGSNSFADFLNWIHPDDRFMFMRKMRIAIKNKEEYNFEIRTYDASQNVRWVKQSGLIHFDELKGKSVLLGIVQDITEQKNYVSDILDAKKRAEESDLLKSTFLATMSHELRTPLNAVIGFSDLILDYDIDAEVTEFVRLINNNGKNLLTLIEDIFDLSLIESNQVKVSKEKFDLVPLLQALSEIIPVEIQKLSKQADIEFQNELPDKQIILYSDASRITQIISNLLKNAIKFTPKGFVKIGIKEDGNDVIVYIQDSGIGISQEKQKIIFEIFRQGEETLTRRFGGAGLGLSLARNLTEILGGRLWVDSEEGKGSIFSFKIKRDISEYEAVNHNNTVANARDWSDKYVLIAEDEYSNFELLSYMLKPTNVRIKNVTNGYDAINEVLNIERPDLILMDVKMPELNGFEATKSIKEIYPNLPIIAQTAFAIMGDRDFALSMGCDEYISKPIKRVELIELMNNYLS